MFYLQNHKKIDSNWKSSVYIMVLLEMSREREKFLFYNKNISFLALFCAYVPFSGLTSDAHIFLSISYMSKPLKVLETTLQDLQFGIWYVPKRLHITHEINCWKSSVTRQFLSRFFRNLNLIFPKLYIQHINIIYGHIITLNSLKSFLTWYYNDILDVRGVTVSWRNLALNEILK